MEEFEVRDSREKNWNWQDNEYLNGYARLCGVSATAVYLSLCRHADKKQSCFPSIKLIAEEHNISERTVITSIHILEKHNIIKKEKIRKKDGKWLNNYYVLLNKLHWISQVQPLHMDSQVQITTEPSANNDISQVQPLHTNKNHIEVDTYKVEPSGLATAKRTEQSFKKEEYNSILEEYQKLKGIKLQGAEFLPYQQAIKTMFMSGRTKDNIIACMKWLAEGREEWMENWTIKTAKMKMPEFIAGKFNKITTISAIVEKKPIRFNDLKIIN